MCIYCHCHIANRSKVQQCISHLYYAMHNILKRERDEDSFNAFLLVLYGSLHTFDPSYSFTPLFPGFCSCSLKSLNPPSVFSCSSHFLLFAFASSSHLSTFNSLRYQHIRHRSLNPPSNKQTRIIPKKRKIKETRKICQMNNSK